jgi:hypothetical protein
MSTNPVVKEGATAVILNGSGQNGLAKQEEQTLISDGVDVTQIATAADIYPSTTLEDNSAGQLPATLSLLNGRYNPVLSSSTSLARAYGVDFVLILGQNWTAQSQ